VRRGLGIADEELVLAFVGGPAHHNRSALAYLEGEVLPRLRRPARLLALGRCADGPAATPAGRTLHLGYVEDLAPLLAAADVGVNPVTAGSGTNCKVALYLAAGLPTLTTPVGLRGYEELADECIVAEPDQFATALAALPVRNGAAARPSAVPDWRDVGTSLLAEYEKLLA
jgi:glycosyltransferase involved in cell wall biosynthesis